MKIEGTITEQDYLKACSLAMKPRLWIAIVGITFVVLYGILVLFAFWDAFNHKDPFIVPLFMIFVAVAMIIMFWSMKKGQKKIYRQETLFQTAFVCTFDNDGLKGRNEYGSSELPWHVFHKWRENNELFLLYFSDLRFHILPKRFFDNPESIKEFRRFAQEKIGKAS